MLGWFLWLPELQTQWEAGEIFKHGEISLAINLPLKRVLRLFYFPSLILVTTVKCLIFVSLSVLIIMVGRINRGGKSTPWRNSKKNHDLKSSVIFTAIIQELPDFMCSFYPSVFAKYYCGNSEPKKVVCYHYSYTFKVIQCRAVLRARFIIR